MVNTRFKALLHGWIVILAILLLASLILSLLLRFTSLGASTLSGTTTIISFLALFAGGWVAGLKAGEKGWLIGILTSLGFSLFIFLYQYLGLQTVFSLSQIFYHTGFLVTGLVGAIFGVNMYRKA
ncbi:TIGR04086 family membrane protein [Paraliobacillus sediminis]|uniref:TIGR04086 family membrane protein n=1 Tax=Paraliobacillus sediminis TaxID=1885916 RepID=UPI000E3DDE63|nr:TIGR04086 family membrane protein [Paraliobacillus sediminis]